MQHTPAKVTIDFAEYNEFLELKRKSEQSLIDGISSEELWRALHIVASGMSDRTPDEVVLEQLKNELGIKYVITENMFKRRLSFEKISNV